MESMSLNRTESLRQAELLTQQGNFAGAISIYNKLLSDNPFDLICVSAIGELYVKKESVQKAIEYFFQSADQYWKKGSLNSVIYVLKKIIKLDPTNVIAYVKLGDIYLRENDNEKAHDNYIEAGAILSQRGNLVTALKAAQKALVAKPDSPQAQAACAALEAELKPPAPEPQTLLNNDGVAPIYISITEAESVAPVPEPEEENTELPDEVKLLQNYDEPANPATLPAEMDDRMVIKKISAAEVKLGYGEIEEALATLKEILWCRPELLDVRIRLKDVYIRAGMLDKASEECINIAGLYAAVGDKARAKDYLMRARLIAARVTA